MAEKDKSLSSNSAPVPPPVRGVSSHEDNAFVDTEAMFMGDEPVSAEIDGDVPAPLAFEPDPPKDPAGYGSLENKIEQNDRSFEMEQEDSGFVGTPYNETALSDNPKTSQDTIGNDDKTNAVQASNALQPPIIPPAPIVPQTSEDMPADTEYVDANDDMSMTMPDDIHSTDTASDTDAAKTDYSQVEIKTDPLSKITDNSSFPAMPAQAPFTSDTTKKSSSREMGTDYQAAEMPTQTVDNTQKTSFPIERINIQPKPKDNIKSQVPLQNGNDKQLKREDVPKKTNYTSPNFLKELFSNGNECITAPGGSYVISDTTRSMLALFSNGRFFVAENHKYDGPPLLFVTDTRRRRLQIGQPEYVPQVVINNIYEYAGKMRSKTPADVEESNQEQARMQRDFVTIVSKAAANHVSDIHIVVADHTTVMFRMNGLMQTEMEYNRDWGESFVRAAFASADISDANYAQNEYQAAQKVGKTALRGSNGKLTLPRNVQGIRLQFNPIAFGTRYVVMRLLYDEDNAESAGDLSILGFEPQETELFYRMRAIPTGMVIVAGPTGSGKSTTLQRNMISMLQERNYELNLITVEDPPEYPIPGARQMPVTNATSEEAKDREFTKALAAALRSDPDALMIGEIRTLAAADLAFRGALSGHSVWTTLHANSAPAIMMRLKDMGVEDFKLQDPSIMKGMLSQRLFRKICPYCRIRAKDRLENPAVQRLRQAYGDMGVELSYLRGPGCKHCEYRGVKGRTVVGEFLLPDATFLDLMIRGESKKAMDYWVTELNGRTLREAAQARMLKGVIDIDEVERWTGLFNDVTV